MQHPQVQYIHIGKGRDPMQYEYRLTILLGMNWRAWMWKTKHIFMKIRILYSRISRNFEGDWHNSSYRVLRQRNLIKWKHLWNIRRRKWNSKCVHSSLPPALFLRRFSPCVGLQIRYTFPRYPHLVVNRKKRSTTGTYNVGFMSVCVCV
jgi:hypothetical protein